MAMDWKPSIGDPTFIGWFTVAAYFSVAGLCAFTARRVGKMIPKEQLGRQRVAWWMMSLFLGALGVNKQLDLQSLLVAIGRSVADWQGWYEKRRKVQLLLVLALMTLAASGMTVLLWTVRHKWREYGWMSVGFALTITFVVVRAASFHHFEGFFKVPIGGMRVHGLLELSAISLVALAALKRMREVGAGREPTP